MFFQRMMYISATISAMVDRNGGRYVIITSPNRPGLPNFSEKTWEGLDMRLVTPTCNTGPECAYDPVNVSAFL